MGAAPALAARAAPPAALRIERDLTERDLRSLKDHRVAGRPVLPAASALGWLAGAGELALPGMRAIAVEDFRVLRGIAPDAPGDARYAIEIAERSRDHGVVEVAATVADAAGDAAGPVGAAGAHFAGRLLLAADPPPAPRVDAVLDADGSASLAPHWNGYASELLHYGPSMSTVDELLALDELRVVTRCVLAPGTPPGFASVYDVATHGVLIWLRHFHGAACLPAVTRRFEHYRDVPAQEPFHVTLTIDAIDASSVEFGFWAYDPDGLAYARGQGLEMVLVPAGSELWRASGIPAAAEPEPR